jgi:hypothetical protein
MSNHTGIDPSYSLGGAFVANTDPQTGRWNRIVIVKNNTSFDAITVQNYTGNTLVGESFPAGFELQGVFTAFTLASGGSVIAYNI